MSGVAFGMGLRDEMEIFKHDLKAEVQVLRNTVSELEMAAQMFSSKIELLRQTTSRCC